MCCGFEVDNTADDVLLYQKAFNILIWKLRFGPFFNLEMKVNTMTKNEIIESIAYANVSPGTTLVEHSIPSIGITFSRLDSSNIGGAKIVTARIFAELLVIDTIGLPDAPSPALLERLHVASRNFHQAQIDGNVIEALEAEIVDSHRKVVACLRKIASELHIPYKEPDDPLSCQQ